MRMPTASNAPRARAVPVQAEERLADATTRQEAWGANDQGEAGEAGAEVEEGICAVCLEELSDSQCSFQCGHLFCGSCDASLARMGDHRCPTCRAPRIGYSASAANQAAAARYAPDTSGDRALAATQQAEGFARHGAERHATRPARGPADGRWAHPRAADPRAAAAAASARAEEAQSESMAPAVASPTVAPAEAVATAEGVTDGSVAVGVPVEAAEVIAEATAQEAVADEAVVESEAEEEAEEEEAAAEAEVEVEVEVEEVDAAEEEELMGAVQAEAEAAHAALDSLQRALGEAEAPHLVGALRTLAVLRWRRAGLWAMGEVSSAARQQAKSAAAEAKAAAAAAAAAAAEKRAAVAQRDTVTAAVEAERGAALAELESVLREERRERASAEAQLMSAQEALSCAQAELTKLQTSGGAAVSAASRIAHSGFALAEGLVAGSAGTSPLKSPERDLAAATTRWPVASGVSTVDCQAASRRLSNRHQELRKRQTIDLGVRELAPAPVLKAKRRRWLLLSCGAARVEPWNE